MYGQARTICGTARSQTIELQNFLAVVARVGPLRLAYPNHMFVPGLQRGSDAVRLFGPVGDTKTRIVARVMLKKGMNVEGIPNDLRGHL